ncbi:proline dehydrogenase family protein, partial [Leptospira ellisii]
SEDSGIPAWIRKTLRFYASLFPISVLFGGFVRFAVGRASGNFIAGRDLKTADANLKRIRAKGNVFTLDVLGEAALSEKEAVAYQKQYLELLRNIGRFSGSETTGYGRSPFVNVSVKCSSLYSQISSLAKEESISALKERLRPILRTAKENGYFANLDAEQSDYKDVLLTLAEEIFSEPDFADYPHFGVVIQTYLRESENDLK